MAENFYTEACALIVQLLEHKGALRENEAQFVDDLSNKLAQYGQQTFLSKRQMDWLRAIAKTHLPDPRQTSFL